MNKRSRKEKIDVVALRDALDAYRKEHGVTYVRMSQQMGYCGSNISQILSSGEITPPLRRALATTFGIICKAAPAPHGDNVVAFPGRSAVDLSRYNVSFTIDQKIRRVNGIVKDGDRVVAASYGWVRKPVTEESVMQAISFCAAMLQNNYAYRQSGESSGADTEEERRRSYC